MKKYRFLFIFLLTLLISSCEKEEMDDVVVFTGKMEEMDNGIIKLNGRVQKGSDVIIMDHGFIFIEGNHDFSFDVETTYKLGEIYENESFEKNIKKSNLLYGVQYKFYAYASTESYTVYGEPISFMLLP